MTSGFQLLVNGIRIPCMGANWVPCEPFASEELTVLSFDEDSVTLKANSYIHIVELEGDCIFSDDYFSVMPGEEKNVKWKLFKGFHDDSFTINAYTLK